MRFEERRLARRAVLGEPGLRDALRRSREPASTTMSSSSSRSRRPRSGCAAARRIALEMGRREENAAGVGQDELLHVEVGDAQHQDVVEPLARSRIERVGSAAAVDAESLRARSTWAVRRRSSFVVSGSASASSSRSAIVAGITLPGSPGSEIRRPPARRLTAVRIGLWERYSRRRCSGGPPSSSPRSRPGGRRRGHRTGDSSAAAHCLAILELFSGRPRSPALETLGGRAGGGQDWIDLSGGDRASRRRGRPPRRR